MAQAPAIFVSPAGTFSADTCEPLKAAEAACAVRIEALARGCYPGRPMPKRVFPEVCTVGYWDAPRQQAWGLDWHRNEGLELTFLARGRADFGVEERTFALARGDLTVTRPWQRHRVGNPHVGPSRLYWLILDLGIRRPDDAWRWPPWLVMAPEDRERLTKLLRHNEQEVWRADAEIARAFERIGSTVERWGEAGSASRLALHLNELFLGLLQLLGRKRVPLDERLASTQRTVELFLVALPKHLEHAWNLDEMAAQCGLARTRFTYYCRELTNTSPLEHLNRLRVQAAAELLRSDPRRSVTEIAFACGFQSSQYFATLFRRLKGCSPRAFRAKTS
ncbi:MAG: AraC family transcriptional regulator [Planctomycetes bacterium]|nr:AraC family transcriptional regulator [Planctomycetota bacterium]